MKQQIKRFIVGVLVLGLFCSAAIADLRVPGMHKVPGPFPPDIARIKTKGTLLVAFYDGNVPPFFYHNAKGEWSGIEVDLAKIIAAQLDVKLIIKASPTYDGIIDMVAKNQVDMGMGLLSITPERALRVRFSNPYYTFHPHLLVSRVQLGELGWNVWDLLSELDTANETVKLGALSNSASYDTLKDLFPRATVVSFPNIDVAMQAATDGKVLAVIGVAPQQVHNWLMKDPENALRAADVPMPTQTILVGIALPWQDESLRQWLNVDIKYMKANNIKAQIFEKYGEVDQEP